MNPFFNPVISLDILRRYLTDPDRIRKLDRERMERYRDMALKKIVRYAYNVPLYHDRYKKAGIHPSDIKGIKDIVKLPFVTKEDLRKNFPDGIVPVGYDKKKAFVVCTGGSTGKPVSIFVDFATMVQASIKALRELRFFGFKWNKTRIAHIGNQSPYRIDLVMEKNFYSHVRTIFSMENFLNIDVNEPIEKIMNRLDRFKPELIYTYPAIHQHLAYLKRKGYGKNVNPKLLWAGGAMLDDYTRRYVEDAFGCKLLNMYPSVEAECNVAFECLEGTWHVNWDFLHVEAIDDDGELVSPGERGHIVITRLWGKGTPIVRYTGMDDWVRISPLEKCSCGLETPVLISGVEGRARANIVLPSGKIFPPGAFCFISPVLHKLNTFKVRQYQIIQKKIDEIEILLVIDDDLRDVGPPVELIFEKIKETYQKRVGPDVKVTVREVKEIKNDQNPNKPPPIVVSYVRPEEGFKVLDK